MPVLKIAIGIVWVYSIYALASPSASIWMTLGQVVFWVMVVIHTAEAVVFQGRIRAAPGSTWRHFAQVLLFGFVHLRHL